MFRKLRNYIICQLYLTTWIFFTFFCYFYYKFFLMLGHLISSTRGRWCSLNAVNSHEEGISCRVFFMQNLCQLKGTCSTTFYLNGNQAIDEYIWKYMLISKCLKVHASFAGTHTFFIQQKWGKVLFWKRWKDDISLLWDLHI